MCGKTDSEEPERMRRTKKNEAQNEEDKTEEEYMQTGTHSTQQILQIKKNECRSSATTHSFPLSLHFMHIRAQTTEPSVAWNAELLRCAVFCCVNLSFARIHTHKIPKQHTLPGVRTRTE